MLIGRVRKHLDYEFIQAANCKTLFQKVALGRLFLGNLFIFMRNG